MIEYVEVFSKLKNVTKSGDNWSAKCPAHDDRMSSLSLKVAESDGRLLMKCHAGCKFGDIISALGLQAKSFFQNSKGAVTIVETESYSYRDANGKLLYQAVRREPKGFRQRRPDGNGGWIWNLQNVERVLYRYPELLEADEKRVVFVVEGEKDVETLAGLGMVATCNPGGAGKWREDFSEALAGRTVVVIPDNDEAGITHAEQVAESVQRYAAQVKLIKLPGLSDKGDITDWIQAGGSRQMLQDLFREVQPWSDSMKAPQEAPDGPVSGSEERGESISVNSREGQREAERLLRGLRRVLERAESLEEKNDHWGIVYLALGIMEELRNGKEAH